MSFTVTWNINSFLMKEKSKVVEFAHFRDLNQVELLLLYYVWRTLSLKQNYIYL